MQRIQRSTWNTHHKRRANEQQHLRRLERCAQVSPAGNYRDSRKHKPELAILLSGTLPFADGKGWAAIVPMGNFIHPPG